MGRKIRQAVNLLMIFYKQWFKLSVFESDKSVRNARDVLTNKVYNFYKDEALKANQSKKCNSYQG